MVERGGGNRRGVQTSKHAHVADPWFAVESFIMWCGWNTVFVLQTFRAETVEGVGSMSAGVVEEVVSKPRMDGHGTGHLIDCGECDHAGFGGAGLRVRAQHGDQIPKGVHLAS